MGTFEGPAGSFAHGHELLEERWLRRREKDFATDNLHVSSATSFQRCVSHDSKGQPLNERERDKCKKRTERETQRQG